MGCVSPVELCQETLTSHSKKEAPELVLPQRAGGGGRARPGGQEHRCPAPAWRGGSGGGGPSGREGREKSGLCVRPRDLVRTGSARLAARGGRGGPTGRGPRWEEGARGAPLRPIWTVGGAAGRRGGRSAGRGRARGLRRAAPRGRRGPCVGGPGRSRGGAGRGRRGSPGSPPWFPAAFRGPHRGAGVEVGAGPPASATQSFQRRFQRVGRGAAAPRSQDSGQE